MLHSGLVKQFVIKQRPKYASAIRWRQANSPCQAIHELDFQHSLPDGVNLNNVAFHDNQLLSSGAALVLTSALTGTKSSLQTGEPLQIDRHNRAVFQIDDTVLERPGL
jgi:hypothetical protein